MSSKEFENLYRNNVLALSNFAHKLSVSRADAKDLLQETALKIFRYRNRYIEQQSFKSWAFAIMKNVFITQYHKRKRRGKINKDFDNIAYAIPSKKNNRPDANLDMEVIDQYIKKLSVKSRKPFILFVQGYLYEEIAKQLNIPIGTVKSRINFARRKLKPQLKAAGLK